MSSKASLSWNKCWKLENCAMSRWSSSNETLKTYIESVQREHFSPFWIKHFILIIFPSRFRPFHFASVLSFNFFPRTVTLTFEFIRSKIQQREDEGSGGARIQKISTARQLSSSSLHWNLKHSLIAQKIYDFFRLLSSVMISHASINVIKKNISSILEKFVISLKWAALDFLHSRESNSFFAFASDRHKLKILSHGSVKRNEIIIFRDI